ncbi:hypothetical protein ABL78_8228 [Leptomonas seymouri]|uniref:Leucine-rich repeat protein (LRRP) n=1 Tax=Leptomonas seymouri TaxID=5684 RepID=A0A0N1I0W0_LEPSE|nr:hypothetical protein ABL78_8228 [Leptomonas seymouri]|eukprot:KPI82758.1 hypothetical protein ABL78_8228 [Leptomonas seymouri]
MDTVSTNEPRPASCASTLTTLLKAFEAWHRQSSTSQGSSLQKNVVKQYLLLDRFDPLAQIVLLSGLRSSIALLASHPQVRLYVELLEARLGGGVTTKLTWKNDRLVRVIKPVGVQTVATALKPILWWLYRCYLPTCIDLGMLEGDVDLAGFSNVEVSSVVGGNALSSVTISNELAPDLRELELSGSAFASLAAAPLRLLRLQTLRLRDFSVAHLQVLCSVQHIEELHIHGTMGWLDMSKLDSARYLRKLYVASTELLNISGLSQCSCLELISVHSSSLRNVAGFGEASNLRKVVVIGGALSELPNFTFTDALECMSLPWCRNITTLSRLTNCASLSKIVAPGSGVRSLEGLSTCPVLELVDFSNCEHLLDLSPLCGAPQLRSIIVSGSAVRNIGGLAACPFLCELDVSWCDSLEDLSPISGAPRLVNVKAACSGVRVIDGLSLCTALESVYFNHCDHLKSLSPLAGAPALCHVYAKGSGVSDVRGLETCKRLRVLDLAKCKNITSAPAGLSHLLN